MTGRRLDTRKHRTKPPPHMDFWVYRDVDMVLLHSPPFFRAVDSGGVFRSGPL